MGLPILHEQVVLGNKPVVSIQIYRTMGEAWSAGTPNGEGSGEGAPFYAPRKILHANRWYISACFLRRLLFFGGGGAQKILSSQYFLSDRPPRDPGSMPLANTPGELRELTKDPGSNRALTHHRNSSPLKWLPSFCFPTSSAPPRKFSTFSWPRHWITNYILFHL